VFIDLSRFLKENMLQRWLTSIGFWGPWMSCYRAVVGRLIDLVSISATFYEKLLRWQIPKAQKHSQAIFCTFGICAHCDGGGRGVKAPSSTACNSQNCQRLSRHWWSMAMKDHVGTQIFNLSSLVVLRRLCICL